jgi:4'-phosphopantetheinyl transferase EntD
VQPEGLEPVAYPGVLIGFRPIAPGDEFALLPDEERSIATNVVAARRASGAARVVARELLGRLGFAGSSIPKSASGAPVWPSGVTGSLAHDETVAVAAAGLSRDLDAVGIDIEPAQPLPSEVLPLVATPEDLAGCGDHAYAGRLVFAAKEAVYKALWSCDGPRLDYLDIRIDLSRGRAATRTGATVDLRYSVGGHILVLAAARAVAGRRG